MKIVQQDCTHFGLLGFERIEAGLNFAIPIVDYLHFFCLLALLLFLPALAILKIILNKCLRFSLFASALGLGLFVLLRACHSSSTKR